MKKTNLLTCFVLALGIANFAAAEEQPAGLAVEKAAADYAQQEDALQKALRERTTDGRNIGEQPRDELRLLVKKSFDARQNLRYAHVKDLERRLHMIERAIQRSQQNEEVIIEARLDDLLSGLPIAGQPQYPRGAFQYVPQQRFSKDGKPVTVYAPGVPGINPFPPQAGQIANPIPQAGQVVSPPLPTFGAGKPMAVPGSTFYAAQEPPAKRPAADVDIETREQLAKLDVRAAERETASALDELTSLQKLEKEGAVSEPQIRAAQNRYEQAKTDLERAKTKLEGSARERSGLIEAAEAEVEEAQAARHKAGAQRQTSIAQVEAAEAEIAKAEAEVASAQAQVNSRQKQYDRVKELAKAKAVDEKLLDEKADDLDAAKGALESAQATVVIANTNARQAKSVVDESLADLELAEARLRAAKARRERLGGANKTQSAPQANPSVEHNR